MRVLFTRCCISLCRRCCRACTPATCAISSSSRHASARASAASSTSAWVVLCNSLYCCISSGSKVPSLVLRPFDWLLVKACTSTTVSSSNRRFCTRRFCCSNARALSTSVLIRASIAAPCTDTSPEMRNISSIRCTLTRSAAVGAAITPAATGCSTADVSGRYLTVPDALESKAVEAARVDGRPGHSPRSIWLAKSNTACSTC